MKDCPVSNSSSLGARCEILILTSSSWLLVHLRFFLVTMERVNSREMAGRGTIDSNPNQTFARILEIVRAHDGTLRVASCYQERHGPNRYEDMTKISQAERESIYIKF